MDKIQLIPPGGTAPITEADLHAYADQQLSTARRAEIEQFLSSRPDERRRVQDWQTQNQSLRHLLNPVLEEPLPLRLPLGPKSTAWPWRSLAAGLAIAVLSAGSAWVARGFVDDGRSARLASNAHPGAVAYQGGDLSGFALRAAVAHVVYSPDVRRPVEVDADQEQQLASWLSKRLGIEIKPPSLHAVGYELIGGRLLPGDTGPVAQFMYHDSTGQRLTLYVTREVPKSVNRPETAFRFGADGPVNVFYWVDKNLGYAISGGSHRAELTRVATEVYRQLNDS
ncbi:MAG: anti-sigma factor [Comamonas sp.]